MRNRDTKELRGVVWTRITLASSHRRGFTLTELLIAIAVLIVVILAASRIFATASQVTGIGQATSDVLTEAAAIERNLRKDIEQLSYEGVFAIRNVAVRNDINGPALLNPELEPDAWLRCDQLVFFTDGVQNSHAARQTQGAFSKGQSTESFVYYGHAFQLPGAKPFQQQSVDRGVAHDVDPNTTVYPWTAGQVSMVNTVFGTAAATGGSLGTGMYAFSGGGTHPIAQPGARQWLLSRNAAILLDDDQQNPNLNSKGVFLDQTPTARSILLNNVALPGLGAAFLSPQIRDGRRDAAATQLADIRQRILFEGPDWQADQRAYILNNLVYYPRAERVAPSTHRIDQALTNHVLSSSCSSFIVEWTYDLGVGEATNSNPITGGSTTYSGLSNFGTNTPSAAYEPVGEIRWFGLSDASRGVFPYSFDQWPDDWEGQIWRFNNITGGSSTEWTILSDNIEQLVTHSRYHEELNYVFGFNQDRPFLHPVTGLPDPSLGVPDTDAAYTPWPSALRITMVLHDPAANLEGGRTFQFIVRLPKRER